MYYIPHLPQATTNAFLQAVVAVPVLSIKAIVKATRAKNALKKDKVRMDKKMHEWAMAEKQRREEMGLPVSDMVLELAK